jgi:hypothetical protein
MDCRATSASAGVASRLLAMELDSEVFQVNRRMWHDFVISWSHDVTKNRLKKSARNAVILVRCSAIIGGVSNVVIRILDFYKMVEIGHKLAILPLTLRMICLVPAIDVSY